MSLALPDSLAALPRRIILSRKGSDAAWGGRPSLRLGTELVSLPIPESAARAAAARLAGEGTRYRDLPSHAQLGPLHEHLRGIVADDYVHLDPDLRPELRPDLRPARRPAWHPAWHHLGARPTPQVGHTVTSVSSARRARRRGICATRTSVPAICSCSSAGSGQLRPQRMADGSASAPTSTAFGAGCRSPRRTSSTALTPQGNFPGQPTIRM